jgi:hypothetical protein
MPISDTNRIYDGFVSLEAGTDAGREPSLIDPNQCVSAENMTFRGGHATARPGFRKLSEDFKNPDHSYWPIQGTDAGTTIVQGHRAIEVYKTGIFQCAVGFSPHHGEDCLMAMIGGRLFKIVPGVTEAVVTEIFPILDSNSPYPGHAPYRNNSTSPIAYMVQADKWLFAQDGFSECIIYDGATARRSNSDVSDPNITEIPVGTIMAYGMGRVVTVVKDRDIAFGDLYGSHDFPDPADSLPLFSERNFLAEGFDAAIPFQQGVATGLCFFPQLDTSTGNGQLMVFAERGAASFFLSLPRDQWKTSQFQVLSLLTTGLRGHRSISVVNEDLWFRSDDGARNFRQARSEATGWAHIPLSTNVKQFLGLDTKWNLKFASSIYLDNRIIFTTSPYWNQGRPFHAGMVVVDFDILSSFGTKFRPAWDGHWTMPNGVRITQLVTGQFDGVTRGFIFGLDENDENQLYEISKDDRDDWDGQRIEWEFVTRAFDFKGQSTPFEENELYDGDVWLREVIE